MALAFSGVFFSRRGLVVLKSTVDECRITCKLLYTPLVNCFNVCLFAPKMCVRA